MLEIMRYPVPAVYPSCRKRISHFSCAGGHIRWADIQSARLRSGNHPPPRLQSGHKAWQKAKIERCKILKLKQTNTLIIKGLTRVINKLKYDLENNLETTDLWLTNKINLVEWLNVVIEININLIFVATIFKFCKTY